MGLTSIFEGKAMGINKKENDDDMVARVKQFKVASPDEKIRKFFNTTPPGVSMPSVPKGKFDFLGRKPPGISMPSIPKGKFDFLERRPPGTDTFNKVKSSFLGMSNTTPKKPDMGFQNKVKDIIGQVGRQPNSVHGMKDDIKVRFQEVINIPRYDNMFDRAKGRILQQNVIKNKFGDLDKDGVMNIFDCQPFDRTKQGGAIDDFGNEKEEEERTVDAETLTYEEMMEAIEKEEEKRKEEPVVETPVETPVVAPVGVPEKPSVVKRFVTGLFERPEKKDEDKEIRRLASQKARGELMLELQKQKSKFLAKKDIKDVARQAKIELDKLEWERKGRTEKAKSIVFEDALGATVSAAQPYGRGLVGTRSGELVGMSLTKPGTLYGTRPDLAVARREVKPFSTIVHETMKFPDERARELVRERSERVEVPREEPRRLPDTPSPEDYRERRPVEQPVAYYTAEPQQVQPVDIPGNGIDPRQYQKLPDGRYRNLKTGKIVTYPRGRYKTKPRYPEY